LFLKESAVGSKVLLALLIVLGLLLADLRFNNLQAARSAVDTVLRPVYWLADLPSRLYQWGHSSLASRGELLEENARLRREQLVLEGRILQLAALRAENVRLRALLNSTALLQNDVLIAELISVSPDPGRHQLIIDRGSEDGVYAGQPVIDASGLLGQVDRVNPGTARLVLITDASHSVPVRVNRNGVRAIAEGTGSLGTLEIHHVAATTDIREGDLLVTSGLGGTFPAGYPVGDVDYIDRDPGKSFAVVRARPRAALDHSRHVLLVFPTEDSLAR